MTHINAFFAPNMLGTIAAGPAHILPEDTFRTMFGDSS